MADKQQITPRPPPNFNASEAKRIADTTANPVNEAMLNHVLNTIWHEARKGVYILVCDSSAVNTWMKFQLQGLGFNVFQSPSSGLWTISWEKH